MLRIHLKQNTKIIKSKGGDKRTGFFGPLFEMVGEGGWGIEMP